MQYYKLIALQIDDFSSSIFFEDNYAPIDFEEANKYKKELEENGFTCILMKMSSIIQI